ncbi:MAG TPA: hypothetical protein PLJ21_11205 [Pseudobdellovibrionaceae bacterium]|nr:hypothetical protein [Pseudobdellovibrionaceae bacterium]
MEKSVDTAQKQTWVYTPLKKADDQYSKEFDDLDGAEIDLKVDESTRSTYQLGIDYSKAKIDKLNAQNDNNLKGMDRLAPSLRYTDARSALIKRKSLLTNIIILSQKFLSENCGLLGSDNKLILDNENQKKIERSLESAINDLAALSILLDDSNLRSVSEMEYKSDTEAIKKAHEDLKQSGIVIIKKNNSQLGIDEQHFKTTLELKKSIDGNALVLEIRNLMFLYDHFTIKYGLDHIQTSENSARRVTTKKASQEFQNSIRSVLRSLITGWSQATITK